MKQALTNARRLHIESLNQEHVILKKVSREFGQLLTNYTDPSQMVVILKKFHQLLVSFQKATKMHAEVNKGRLRCTEVENFLSGAEKTYQQLENMVKRQHARRDRECQGLGHAARDACMATANETQHLLHATRITYTVIKRAIQQLLTAAKTLKKDTNQNSCFTPEEDALYSRVPV